MRKKLFSYDCATCRETYHVNTRPKDGKVCAICAAVPSKAVVKLTVAINKLTLLEARAVVELAKKRVKAVEALAAQVIVVRYQTSSLGDEVRSGGMIYGNLAKLRAKFPAPKYQLTCAGVASLRATSIGTISRK